MARPGTDDPGMERFHRAWPAQLVAWPGPVGHGMAWHGTSLSYGINLRIAESTLGSIALWAGMMAVTATP